MNELLNLTIFTIGNYELKVTNIVGLFIFIISIIIILAIIKAAIFRVSKLDESKKYTVNQLVKYFVIVFSVVIGLQIIGFNISVILAGSAALLVGLGLGMQHLFSDFISGIVILVDGSIKMDDVIEVNNEIYRVKEINLRTTKVYGRNENNIILPNTELTSGKIINWTHDDASARFKVTVGVSYSSDIDLVMKIIVEETVKHTLVNNDHKPFARFDSYGDSSLDFSVFFWSDEIFEVEFTKSEIRTAIFKAFKANGVEIPFPQRVVHLKN